MNKGPKVPPDLDGPARKKWAALISVVDPDADLELLGNFCRQHSSLLGIRAEKAKLIKAGTFSTMVPGRDKALQLNPLLTGENRLVASLNRMLRTLGLTPGREEQDRRSGKQPQSDPPPGMSGQEPRHGWELEVALCRGRLAPTPKQVEEDRLRDVWLAARRNQEGERHGRNL
jgi:phage terminase small subunit